MSTDIRSMARARAITALYHFTPMANLASILTYGLVARSLLNAFHQPYTYTDSVRADGQLDAISLSIHSVNRAMFAAKQRQSRCDWAILEIDASVLWTHNCRFCWTNAASTQITRHTGRLDGPWGFAAMFKDRPVSAIDHRSLRALHNTPRNLPTYNDAEVLVRAHIAPDLIRDISVARPSVQARSEAIMKQVGRALPVVVVPDAFA